MNNDWLDDLRMKMKDHAEEVPEGLWDDIEDELFGDEDGIQAVFQAAEDNTAKSNGEEESSVFKLKPLYRAVGAAAAIALFFVVGNRIFDYFTGNASSERVIKADKRDVFQSVENQGDLIADDQHSASGLSEKAKMPELVKYQNSRTDIFEKIFHIENKKEVDIQSIIGENKKVSSRYKNEDTPQKQNEVIENKISDEKDDFAELISNNGIKKEIPGPGKIKKPVSRKFWMLSMLAGNAASSADQIPGYATISGAPIKADDIYQSSGTEVNPLVAVLVANQDQNVDARFVHKMPFTLGASVYHSLGKYGKWGIGTGVNYTKLSSEVRSGSQANFIKSEQTLHYIGIPVQVNYSVVQKGKFIGYITGGTMIEKAVAADLKTQYVVNEEVKESTTEKIDQKPFQFSVNSAVGVQYKIVNKIGLYAEPGVGYHFKDNSTLNTIYKEKPLNFNIKFGIRVLIE